MSLSRHLQAPELLKQLPSLTPEQLRPLIVQRGCEYLDAHPEESQVVEQNLRAFALDASASRVRAIQEQVVLHYFEKLVALCGTPATLRQFLTSRVDASDAVDTIRAIVESGKGVLLATCHFGAVELVAPTILMHKLRVTGVLRFTTAQLSESVTRKAQQLSASGEFGLARFIEIGKPGTIAAVEMAAVLRRAEVLLAVFDEDTGYSTPVTLLGRQVKGGAGLHRILKFVNAPVRVVCACMVRTGETSYRLEARELPDNSNPVEGMYAHLEQILANHLEQWYFLHEEIPFVQ